MLKWLAGPRKTPALSLTDDPLAAIPLPPHPDAPSELYAVTRVNPLFHEEEERGAAPVLREDALTVLEQNVSFVKSILVAVRGRNLHPILEGHVDIPRPVWPRDAHDSLVDDALLLYTSLTYHDDAQIRAIAADPVVSQCLEKLRETPPEEALRQLSETLSQSKHVVHMTRALSTCGSLRTSRPDSGSSSSAASSSGFSDLSPTSGSSESPGSRRLTQQIAGYTVLVSSGSSSDSSVNRRLAQKSGYANVPLSASSDSSGSPRLEQANGYKQIVSSASSDSSGSPRLPPVHVYANVVCSGSSDSSGSPRFKPSQGFSDANSSESSSESSPNARLQPNCESTTEDSSSGSETYAKALIPSSAGHASSAVAMTNSRSAASPEPPDKALSVQDRLKQADGLESAVFVHADPGSVPAAVRNALIYGTLIGADRKAQDNSTDHLKRWDTYCGTGVIKGDVRLSSKDNPFYDGPDFTLDESRAARLLRKVKQAKKRRCVGRLVTSLLGLLVFLLSLVVVSVMVSRGKKVFGSL